MSTRLTNDIRDSIATAVLRHRFNEQVDALIADRAAFADAVYCDIYRKADREKMDDLPNGWLPESARIGVQFGSSGSRFEYLHFDGCVYGPLDAMRSKNDGKRVERRITAKHSYGCAKVYEDGHKLSQRHAELSNRFEALKAEHQTAERQTKAALSSVGTIKRLIEAWPEVEPFASKFEDAPKNLPSVPTSKLNEMLGLPVAA